MEKLMNILRDSLNEDLIKIVISSPRKAADIKRYSIRPVLLKGRLMFQSEGRSQTQAFHENLDSRDELLWMEDMLPLYRQVQVYTKKENITALISKKGKAAIRRTGAHPKPEKGAVREKTGSSGADYLRLSHNRTKRYILPEGTPVPFLVDLGVMTETGTIVKKRYDKFRQINRFLEYIEDVLPELPKDREVRILDFGCGKSYLTFAMYYYLKILKGYNVAITGLDLKKKVINDCHLLADRYGYETLHFLTGTIEEYELNGHVDMVVTLHACDTATDYALYKAVVWGADVILSVPCCQHELNGQYHQDGFKPISDYGILRERFCALATDGIRAKVLEACGYETQILEFIDMEHTPKNLLIRAVKKKKEQNVDEKVDIEEDVRGFCRQFGFCPSIVSLLLKEEQG